MNNQPTPSFRPRRAALNQAWQIGQAPRLPFNGPDVNNLKAVRNWLPAAVPGNIRTDLMALNMIPEPYFNQQYQAANWVDSVDWWYKTTFKAKLLRNQRAFIRFQGIDYRSAIFVNEQELSRHEGMFSPQTVEITPYLASGSCQMAVRVWGGGALPRRNLSLRQRLWAIFAQQIQRSWVGIYPDRTATLKMQMSFGWDFAPRILTLGLWDEVEAIISGSVFIEDCRIHVEENGQGKVHLRLNCARVESAPIIISATPHNFAGETIRLSLAEYAFHPGARALEIPITLPEPKLWHPWDRGFPHLYRLDVEIPDSDSLSQTFGVRKVERNNWQFKINGQNEFIRGLNWVPADVFPGRVGAKDYERLIKMAKESGANFLRVWGGGLREKTAFYDICDAEGMLVWQEFPFSCVFLGTFPDDEAYLALARQEVGEIVRQLDNHPSVIAWCGGNELSPRRNPKLAQTIAQTVSAVSRSPRPFIPASPSPGDSHNWQVWHGQLPFAAYQQETANFLSEHGLQALPAKASLQAMLSNPGENWASHNGHAGKLSRYYKLFLKQENTALDEKIAASQLAQAVGLQTAIEHMRRRKAQSGGVAIWQFNEPWPAISWAIVDYFKRPKLAYERLKTWYHPILISLSFEPGQNWQAGDVFRAEVWGINDTLKPLGGSWRVTLDHEIIAQSNEAFVEADSAACLGQIEITLSAKPAQISAVWQAGEQILSENCYELDWFDDRQPSLWKRFRRWGANLVLR